ncbi:MAG: ABC transporter permease [Thermoanaerobaculaceae bacterium]|nr:ABC transporter permease [Thermoanaerobaculaceae bacterium]MDI9622909.1 FtsX-like permease family protein [Acidobacteriota bacterium]NLH10324.1 FtsX-like permease family protein [Holophagae bacterium]HPW56966.1 FtsX-like permease family protein [Thermoanaerobaculaceae bacterium]
MKYLPLVWANLTRKKIRTTLTIGSFLIAMTLYGLLAAVHAAFYQGVDVAGANRLVVINRTSLTQPLPVSYRERLLQIDGVTAATHASWFGGVYQEEKNFFAQLAIETETYHEVFPEVVIDPGQWRDFVADRQGCVVGAATAERYGFALGDRVPLRGTIFPGTWELNVRAIYTDPRPGGDETQLWFHKKYLEENGPNWFKGLVGWYTVVVASPDRAVEVARAIDERFANSAHETKTEPERAFAAAFVKQVGNLELIILSIGGVVFFTLLLVTGNTMATSVRERVGELAVLKTVGYSDRFVLGLVLVESLLIALQGGLLGMLVALGIAPGLGQVVPGLTFFVPLSHLVQGVVLTVLVGLGAGLLPALAAMRLRVVDALRRV